MRVIDEISQLLRQAANVAPLPRDPWSNALRAAADEIDRLTRQLAEAREGKENYRKLWDAKAAEVMQLNRQLTEARADAKIVAFHLRRGDYQDPRAVSQMIDALEKVSASGDDAHTAAMGTTNE